MATARNKKTTTAGSSKVGKKTPKASPSKKAKATSKAAGKAPSKTTAKAKAATKKKSPKVTTKVVAKSREKTKAAPVAKKSAATKAKASSTKKAAQKKTSASTKAAATKKAVAQKATTKKALPKKAPTKKVVPKKVMPKKVPVKKPVPKKRAKPKVDPEFVSKMRVLLGQQRQRLLSVVQTTQAQMAARDGDLADVSDRASGGVEDELAVSLMAVEAAQLSDIEAAIRRIDEGTYGICIDTEKPIAKARLEALPFALRSLEAEGMRERGIPIRRNEFSD